MISDAILLIQTANAAIGAVKELVGNGKDLSDCGKHLGTYFDSKAKIQLNASSSGSGSDLELFFAHQKLLEQEADLKELLIYSGRAGLWSEWLQFASAQKRKREDVKADIQAKKMARSKAIKNGLAIVCGVLAILSAVGAAGLMVYWLIVLKGK